MDRRDFIKNSAVALGSLVSETGEGAGAQRQRLIGRETGEIVLNEKEYFEAPGFAFLVYHNNYSGMEGGLQMIQRGERLLDSGRLLLTAKDRSVSTVARVRRVIDPQRSTATILGEVADLKLGYQLTCRATGKRMFVTLKLDRPLDWSEIGEAAFQIFLYPPVYFEKSFQGESATGVFPRRFSGDPVLLRSTRVLRIAEEDPMHSVTLERHGAGTLQLGDERGHHPTAWFSVLAPIEPGSTATEVEVEIRPGIDPQWRRPPSIGVSQVGYHPKQPKRAVIELDPRDDLLGEVSLIKLELDGDKKLIKANKLKEWGRFLYYRYGIFDFSEIVDPGVYILEFRDQRAGPFRIDTQVYNQAWRPTLEVFLPVQMCHVSVREGNRNWHGACHLDDALQAPEDTNHFDSYQQGKRETSFADYQHIPGLNRGGWHDAGDFDLPSGSIANTTLALALAQEEFQPRLDQTTIRRAEREVLLHVPDGEEDLLQQVECGVENLLASFRAAGHIFAGIIESTSKQYDHTGDPVNITDNLVFDSSLSPDQVAVGRSGTRDDRWAFTNRNTGLQYRVVQTLAVAARVLRDTKTALADECVVAARTIWDYEQTNAPVYSPNAYVSSRAPDFPTDEIASTAELWLTTDDVRYKNRLYSLMEQIRTASPEQFGHGPGWTLVRLMTKTSDPEYRRVILEKATSWKAVVDAMEASNPYGVRFPSGVLRADWKLDSPTRVSGAASMGFGWNMQTDAMHHYFFHKHLPDIFDSNSIFTVVNFVLGCHPSSNTSYVSGVGTNSALLAYGFNRDAWTHIPGGVISGVSLIKPDFMELKNFPYHFFQTEYVIHGAASYIFAVLAAQWVLQH